MGYSCHMLINDHSLISLWIGSTCMLIFWSKNSCWIVFNTIVSHVLVVVCLLTNFPILFVSQRSRSRRSRRIWRPLWWWGFLVSLNTVCDRRSNLEPGPLRPCKLLIGLSHLLFSLEMGPSIVWWQDWLRSGQLCSLCIVLGLAGSKSPEVYAGLILLYVGKWSICKKSVHGN